MRVAYFTNQYPAPSHTFIRREAVALEKRGHIVRRYAARHYPAELTDRDDQAELPHTKHILGRGLAPVVAEAMRAACAHPRGALSGLRKAFAYARAANGSLPRHLVYWMEALVLARWCRLDRVEHLHVHFGTNPATVAAITHAVSGVPFSFTVHGPEEFDRAEHLDLKSKIDAAAFVVGVSSFGKSQLMRWADARNWNKLHVVRCGLDEPFFAQVPPEPSTRPRLFCLARMSEQKGHMILLEAAAALKKDGVEFELVLAGDGPLRSAIELEIARLGLEDHVLLTGWLSQEAARGEIAKARAMVLPSLAEGLPVVFMESMALGRPVISTFIAGIPELVCGQSGWLVPAGDTTSLKVAMQQALEAGPEEMQRKGALARARVAAFHHIARSVGELEALMLGKPLSETA